MKEPEEIKESDTWRQFCSSGRIEDYLRYASCKNEKNSQSKESDWVGDSPHAGFYTSDGNYIETDAYR